MRIIFLLLLVTSVLSAQTIPEPVLVDLGDNHFTLCSAKTSGASITNARIQRTDNATWSAEFTNCHDSASGSCTDGFATLPENRTSACVYVTDVKANTAYLVHMNFWNGSWTSETDSTYQTNIQQASVCAAYPSNCTDVDQDGGGAGTDRAIQITTTNTSAGVDTPTAPSHSNSFSAMTAIDNEVVLSVTDGVCDDPQTEIDDQIDAFNAAGAVHYAVKIPNAAECYPGTGNYWYIKDLTNTSGTFTLYTEEADTDANPPAGGLIARTSTGGALMQNKTVSLGVPLVQLQGTGQQNLRLKGIGIKRPPATTTNYAELEIEAWTSQTKPVLTTAAYDTDEWGATGQGLFSPTIYLKASDIQSPELRTGLEQALDARIDAWTQTNSTTLTSPTTHSPTEPGTPTSGGNRGVMSREVTRSWSATGQTTSPTVTFGENINFATGYSHAITGITGGVITATSGAHQDNATSGFRRVMYVTGSTGTGASTDAQCNTWFTATSVNRSSGTWTITNTSVTCSGGTVRMLEHAYFHDMSGYTHENMSCIFEVITQTTVKIYYCIVDKTENAFVPDFTSMSVTGYMAFAPPIQPPLLDLGGATGVIIESVLFDAGGYPYVSTDVITSDSGDKDLIIIGSRSIGAVYGNAVNPVTGQANTSNRLNLNTFPVFLRCTGCTDIQLINNAHESPQSFLLMPNDSNITTPADYTISGLIYTQPPNNNSDDPLSGGVQYPSRQVIEGKNGGLRMLIEGMVVAQQKANLTGTVSAVLFQTVGSGSDTSGKLMVNKDIDIKNNFVKGMSGFSVNTTTVSTSNLRYTAHGPVRIHNNLFVPELQNDKPSADFLNIDGYGGYFTPLFARLALIRDLTLTDNTIAPIREPYRSGDGTDFNVGFDFQNMKTAAIRMTGNLYSNMGAGLTNYNLLRISGTQTWAALSDVWTADGALSTVDTLSGNRVVACSESPTTYSLSATNNAHSEANTMLTNIGGDMLTNWPLTPLSADSQSCNTRLDEVMTSGSWDASGSEGADVDAILDAIGQIRLITVTDILSYSATVNFTPPSSSSTCNLIYKAAPVTSFQSETGITATTPTTSGATRSVVINGLSSYTQYDAQIQCDRGERVYVSFATTI